MTRDDILRMAREADLPPCHTTHPKALDRFANLVANHVLVQPCCGNFEKCQRLCMPRAAAAEREACAVIAFNAKTYIEAAKAIRARSK